MAAGLSRLRYVTNYETLSVPITNATPITMESCISRGLHAFIVFTGIMQRYIITGDVFGLKYETSYEHTSDFR